MDVGDAMSTTSVIVVKVSFENPVGLELGEILYKQIRNLIEYLF